MKVKTIATTLSAALLAGCIEGTQPLLVETDTNRVQIKVISVVEDWSAYENRRTIYEIIDTKTDRQWIGISGVGIAENGAHK
jgi:hypothetical protein